MRVGVSFFHLLNLVCCSDGLVLFQAIVQVPLSHSSVIAADTALFHTQILWHFPFLDLPAPFSKDSTCLSQPQSLSWQPEFPVCTNKASLKCWGRLPPPGSIPNQWLPSHGMNTPVPSPLGMMALAGCMSSAAFEHSPAGLNPRSPWWYLATFPTLSHLPIPQLVFSGVPLQINTREFLF